MTRHSTNDTELFRKMTSLILMGKISPPGHCLIILGLANSNGRVIDPAMEHLSNFGAFKNS